MQGAIISGIVNLTVNIAGKYITCDEEWWVGGSNIDTEIGKVGQRYSGGDHYPQGVDHVISLMRDARANNKQIHILAKKTWPKWTWFIDEVK
ncbi:hypothetical protein M9Y10_033788 [Tritrichomonas musculus]|uniref:Uncharacterized protein n=1 Tax=Tritrichomonas musculus TaxID=1915356 RepID=A0ABR2KD40_9EUKA